jgi:hypothetical protein
VGRYLENDMTPQWIEFRFCHANGDLIATKTFGGTSHQRRVAMRRVHREAQKTGWRVIVKKYVWNKDTEAHHNARCVSVTG